MPLPLVPVAVFAFRAGLAATAFWAVRRTIARAMQVGRTDQRAEEALAHFGLLSGGIKTSLSANMRSF